MCKSHVLRGHANGNGVQKIFHRTESLDFGILHEGEITWSISQYSTIVLLPVFIDTSLAASMTEFALK